MSSHLPPLRSNGVFSVSSSCSIDAPLEKVWSILLDFPSYKKWQGFNAYFFAARSQFTSRNSFVYENYACPEMCLSLILFIDAVKLL